MSTPVDLSEFLEAYLGEADEHLASANAQLLAIDAALRRGDPVARQVRELFRALHTLKGLSAMVGVDPIVAIAHRMETVLRMADRAGGRLPKGAVDLLLQGTRAIEQRVRALHAGARPADAPTGLLDALDALEADASVGAPPPARALDLDAAIGSKLAPSDHQTLEAGIARGRRAICARFAPSAAQAEAGVTINTVREKLAGLGEIVKVVPLAVAPSPAAPAGLAFGLVALTDATDDALAVATGIPAAAIVTIATPRPATPAPEAEPDILGEDDAAVRRSGVVRVDVVRLDLALERLSALIVSRSQLGREITRLTGLGIDTRGLLAIAREQARQLKDLRAAILGLRMVPMSEVLERVPLIVRGLRRSTGKAVRLSVDVGRAELDKAVAERIFPALVHLVRNAVDHGIESPRERRAAGKPDDGNLVIECAAVGNGQLEIRITDDGRGIDRAALARRAGLPAPESDAATLALLCRPGLSTREEADDTSGRGMGMDIVRRVVVEHLGGQLAMTSTPGAGTTFVVRVPLTISIVDAFTFECGTQRFAVPLSTIDEIVEVDIGAIATAPGQSADTGALGVLERRGLAMSVLRLDDVLGVAHERAPAPRAKGLVIRSASEPVAFLVDRMLGQQEIVVRALEDPLVTVTGISGATDLGDGQPTLIVDLVALSSRHLERRTTTAHRERAR